MKARLWNRNTDYEMLLKWWEGHQCTSDYVIPSHRLPPSGWVIEDDDGTPLCITWLYYMKHVSGAYLGSILSNPEIDPKINSKAIDLLFLQVIIEADKNNTEFVLGITTREGVVRKAAKYGFRQATKHSVEFQRERGGVCGK